MSADDFSEMPWTTAPEYAVDGLDELGVEPESEFWNAAIGRARRHGLEHPDETFGDSTPKPKSVAAGAIYLTGILQLPKITQAQIEEAMGVTHSTVTRTYRPMARAEGYEIPSSTSSSDEEDGIGWFGRLKHAAEVVSR